MADFLTIVSSKATTPAKGLDQEAGSLNTQDKVQINSAEAALEAIKREPSRDTVKSVLLYLTTNGSNLVLPGPQNASIAHHLVNNTIPNYWRTWKAAPESSLVVQILRNPTGLGHVITRLRALIMDSREKKAPGIARNTIEHIEDVLDLVSQIIQGDRTSENVLKDILAHANTTHLKKLIWREYLAQTASGQLLSVVAEAEDVLKKGEIPRARNWIAEGGKYATWLGHNAAELLLSPDMSVEHTTASVEFSVKLLTLGYIDYITQSLLFTLIKQNRVETFTKLLSMMKGFEQRKYMDATISFVANKFFSAHSDKKVDEPIAASMPISGAAGLFSQIIKDNSVLKDHFISTLTRSAAPSLNHSVAVRRSVIAALSRDEEILYTLLENGIKQFGETIYIKHAPILQQEALAQTLALCSGYVHRTQPMFLIMMAKSTHHIDGMSNRIGAASARARFLGIAVGIAISRMVDKPEVQLKFELDSIENEEARWYQRLTQVDDEVGSICDLAVSSNVTSAQQNAKPRSTLLKATESQIINGPRVVEIVSDGEHDDNDLLIYEKPDSDREDDTDDPTAVNRGKPSPPVYIRDLITGLRDQDNHERHELALSAAASLIRRKANFGTEVVDHLEELAAILTGLQDNLDLEGFAQHRQQALIAVLLVEPARMAQWFSRSFFSGDYSLTQRIAMLTTLGIGARQLADIQDSSTDDLVPAQPSFPSKQLPPHLHKTYTGDNATATVAKISNTMARQMLSPMASAAAEQLNGPKILQVRTFSSRMQVEKKRKKPTPNSLAQIVADNFFFPLTGRWWMQTRASSDSIYSSTHLLPSFLQTLSLLLHASGPNTLALPQMTREYWDLLLAVRGLAATDTNVLNAVLFGFLMLLETNENKERLASEQGKELVETQAWAKMVFEGLGAASGEEERVRALAAGVVVRCQEVVDKYQRRMAGVLMDS